jgi:hypothetical protein
MHTYKASFVNMKGTVYIAMNRNYLIHILKQYGVITTDNKLHIKFMKKLMTYPTLSQAVVEATYFLRGSACLKTRLHALLQGISEQPVCKTCGKDVKMRLNGKYRFTFPTYCSSACFAGLEETNEKRNLTNHERYGAVSYTATKEYRRRFN